MIDIKLLRQDPDFFSRSAQAKNVDINIDRILELDREARSLQIEIEGMAAKKNEASKQIAAASDSERQQIISNMKGIDREEEALKEKYTPIQEELTELLFRIPNPAAADVKVSASEADNEVIKTVGTKPEFTFTPKDHLELGQQLDIIDQERSAKVSGSRFVFLKGDGALLQMALTQYALSITTKHGFTPVLVPHLITAEAMRAMGYLEHGGHDEIYFLPKDNLYLIGTSEQSIGPMHMNEIIDVEKPLRYVGISSCYRRESGSYGKDTKGMIRMHQFDKVEMFSFTKPEESDQEHEFILSVEEELMQGLGLHYQVVKMVSGDLGLPAARKYDIETWLPSQDTFRETHSCSTTTDFQTRRLNTRFKRDDKNEFAHALNGTALAMSRAVVMIVENFQQADGTIKIPEVLRPFMGGREIIEPRQ